MANKNKTEHETILRNAFRRMDGDEYQTIRQAYYKAVEGLRALADALENAAEPSGEASEALIAEHLIACSAINAMDSSELGVIL